MLESRNTVSPNASSYTSDAVGPSLRLLLVLLDLTLTTVLPLPVDTCFSASSQPGAPASISYLASLN
jgi:hypothetical protein